MCGEIIYSASGVPSPPGIWGSALGGSAQGWWLHTHSQKSWKPEPEELEIKAVSQTLAVPQRRIDFCGTRTRKGSSMGFLFFRCALKTQLVTGPTGH